MEPSAAGPPPQIGSLVSTYRHQAKLTQRELAARAGLSVAALRDYEQGRRHRLRPNSLAALIDALGLKADQAASLTRAAAIPRRPPGLRPWPRPSREGASARVVDEFKCDRGFRLAVLGPLEAWRRGTPLSLGPPARRAILGLLQS